MLRFIVFLFSGVLFLTTLAVAGVGGVLVYYTRSLPDYQQLETYVPPVTTRLYAGDGRLMNEYAVQKRIFVPVGAIPQQVISAFLAAEDKNFYTHQGVDPTGLARAIVVNVRNMGKERRPMGASTITQQVAKNFLLTNEVSVARKVKEALLAYRIEKAFSKEHILELYLNEIYLGFGSYGVAAAALNYFNKSLDQLSVAEVAYLAALPKAPNNYHPIRMHAAALERRNWVISRMLEDGHISQEQARMAVMEPLEVRSRDETEYVQGGEYFSEEVRRELVEKYGEDQLYKGGLAVRTTLDPDLQKSANSSLHSGLLDYDRRHGWRGPVARIDINTGDWRQRLQAVPPPSGMLETWSLAVVLEAKGTADVHIGLRNGSPGLISLSELKWARPWKENQQLGGSVNRVTDVVQPGDVIMVETTGKNGQYYLRQIPNVNGAMVALDPHTGRVLAMVGGWSIRASEFNRATQALRQPGSSFKPFVYLAALENGYTPSTLVLDAPFVYEQGPGLPVWRPKNYSGEYFGPSTLRTGIEKSRNLMTVRLAQAVGMEKVAAKAETFGIDKKFPRLLAASLGAGETTVLRMSAAYGMLANGGKRLTPTLIDRIQDRDGRTIYKHDQRPCDNCEGDFWLGRSMPEVLDEREQIADPRSVYQITHIMEGVIQYGTARKLAALNVPLAGKTGTTNDSVDTWFMCFTPDLVVGVFVGFDEPKSLGGKETGSSTALPVAEAFLKEALKGKAVRPFPVPSGIQFMRVNHQTGQLAQYGDNDIISEAFKVEISPLTTPQTVLDGSAVDSSAATTAAPTTPADVVIEEGGDPQSSTSATIPTPAIPGYVPSVPEPAVPPSQGETPAPLPSSPAPKSNGSSSGQPQAGGLY